MQPIFILSEGSERTSGKSAQSTNIAAAKAVAETVRTTLGPKGMDKMLVTSLGDIIVTNDGYTILTEMDIENPSAKMIVEVAKTQQEEVGDGTTTAVVLAGELLKNAEALLAQNVHPTVISRGYRLAAQKAISIVQEAAETVTRKDSAVLENISMTAMTGKSAESSKEKLAKLVVNAVLLTMDLSNNAPDVKIEKKSGASADSSELIEGIVLDKERSHTGMPRIVNEARIALVSKELELKKTEIDSSFQLKEASQLTALIEMEQASLRKMADRIASSGANAVFCQKGIDDTVKHFLSKKGIFAVERVSEDNMEKLAKATGGRITGSLDDLSAAELGQAGCIEQKKVADDEMIFIGKCKNPLSVTLLVRGGTSHVVDELERAVTDAVGDVAAALSVGKVVAGAGAPEMEISKGLRKYATSLSGREQLAVIAFAEAVEIIPRTLAENAGLDPIDVLTELKAAHDKGQKWAGIDVFTGKIVDSWAAGVIEPLKIKTQAIKSASEVAEMLLRIDDVIASGKPRGSPQPNYE